MKRILDIEIYKALSDESRLRILNLLLQTKLCVCEIEVVLDISQSNASRHLSKLKNAEIIVSKKEAQWVYHDMNEEFMRENKNLCRHLRKKFNINELFLEDIRKLDALKKKGCSCNEIIRRKKV